jgi:hypothetical protein
MNMQEIKELLSVHQGMIEVILGFITAKSSKKELMDFLQVVVDSPKHSKESKTFARGMLSQDNLWPPELLGDRRKQN